jgi:hypothetical protein
MDLQMFKLMRAPLRCARGPAAQGVIVFQGILRPDFAALDSLRSSRAKALNRALIRVSCGPENRKDGTPEKCWNEGNQSLHASEK